MAFVDGVMQVEGTPWELDEESPVWLSDKVCQKNGWKLSQGSQVGLKLPEWLLKGMGQYTGRDSNIYSGIPEFMRDACFRRYRECMRNEPDGYDGELAMEFFLHEEEIRASHLETILEETVKRLEWCRKWDDVSGFRRLCTKLDMHLSDLSSTAPPKYLDQIRALKEQAESCMRAIAR